MHAKTWWFTGLPGAGKTTLARAWAGQLQHNQHNVVVLDGDELRLGLSRDLGFSETDRFENMRRVAEVARLLNEAGIHALVALVSPSVAGRTNARQIVGSAHFIEIYVATSLAVCQQRDPKGLYRRAAGNEQFGLTGAQSLYEPPLNPELVIDTGCVSVATAMALLEVVAGNSSAPTVPTRLLM